MLSPANDNSKESISYENLSADDNTNEAGCEKRISTTAKNGHTSEYLIHSNNFCADNERPLQFSSTNGGEYGKDSAGMNDKIGKDDRCMIGPFDCKEPTIVGSKNDPEDGKCISEEESSGNSQLLYSIDEVPPWYLALGLGFQQYLLMFSSTMVIPFILSEPLCFSDKPIVISNILSTIIFVAGIVTFLQSTFGCRLPIVQGTSFAFIAPTISSMALKGPCISNAPMSTVNPRSTLSLNLSTAITPTDQDREWKSRMLEVQGAIIVASIVQITIGFSGLLGYVLKYIGPLTIVPTIVLVGMPLFETAYRYSSVHWGIAMFTLISVIIFSQLLREVKTPVPYYREGRWQLFWLPSFKLFPVILSIFLSWILCAVLTESGAFPSGHKARTDRRMSVLRQVRWFRVPYPGQWGTPTMVLSTIIGMLAGVFASMIESIGDYYACAAISGAPPPPRHAINRGLGMEGVGCLLTGAWGTGCGTTSYSNNIASLGITRVGSRRVIQYGAIFMILLGVIGKFGALFITIPDPVIGGIFISLFGLLIGVGISPLQFIDLNSMRNLFIVGNALFFGMVLPFWVKWTPHAIKTGSPQFDQVITVLVSTPMAIGGVTGFVLDNLIPGTLEERGLIQWKRSTTRAGDQTKHAASVHTYDIPFITPYLQRFRIVKYLPFLPYYKKGYFENQCQDVASRKL